MKNILYILTLSLLWACSGEDFLEEAKPDINQARDEIESNTTLDDLVRGAYFNLKSPGDLGPIDLLIYQTVATDIVELKEYSDILSGSRNLQPLYLRQDEINDIRIVEWPWAGAQTLLFNVNTVLQFYEQNEVPTDGLEDWVPRIRGEAYFLRAFAHYLLATTYAPPYSSDPQAEGIILQTAPASSPTDFKGLATNQQVYDQIISDLKNAIELLPETYDVSVHPEDYQDRAKRDAARFLLAKVYFLMGNEFWTAGQDGDGGALEQIDAVITSNRFPLLQSDSLQQIFLKKGLGDQASETVWYASYYFRNGWRTPRLEPIYSNFTGNRQRGFAVSKATLEAIGWDDPAMAQQDERYNDWYRRFEQNPADSAGIDPAFAGEYTDAYNVWCGKFADNTANFVIFRSPELYLMRAAIRLAAGDGAGAAADLNVTRERAGLPALTTATAANIDAEWIKEMGFEGRRLFYLQAQQLAVPPGDRAGATEIPYDDPSLVRMLPRVELTRNPALAGGE
ncbi:RagB/SusD family nutrient uptake outer membrane protein [Tunicatimonas pelagia]|uniref:RagB/SusD family nutrient uptake outer membrane protein n=1 Tax=Tunicatimonas pelagia TaxID=931531 RepID=UPI002666790B|nr:RagB/SusD family nutrient uptake outer membrane protein [Tunicatimonas pelagia]WKN44882.1 RagB/SusD family nutrient uptake outer membrane protein [Tunicatimonas pelagia]